MNKTPLHPMNLFFLVSAAAMVLGGCATQQSPIAAIDSEHPASPLAMEGRLPAPISLRNDPATRRTQELIEQRQKQVEQPAGEGTSSGGQIAKPAEENKKPESKTHEHQH